MNTTLKTKSDIIKKLTVTIPISAFEKNRLDKYIKQEGLKKGAFVRKAILAYLDLQEARGEGQA